jgi:hypothetical protein
MLRHLIVAGLVATAVAGCANDAPSPASFTNVAMLKPPAVETAAMAYPEGQPPKKTMSDKVLAAIALERVTGLKPDPGRLAH